MIVECYSADVYCDLESHPHGTVGEMSDPDVFTGRSKRETDRKRRKCGWIRVAGKDVCPECAGKMRAGESTREEGEP